MRRSTVLRLTAAAAAAAPAGPAVRGAPTTGTGAPALPAHQAGDVLVVFCSFLTSPGNLSAAGWTRRSALNGTSAFLYAYTLVAASAAESIALGTAPSCYVAYAVRGGAGVDVVANGTVNSPSTSCPAPSVTATAAAVLLSGYATGLAGLSITPPGSETPSAQAAGTTLLRCGSEVVKAGATGTRTATLGAADNSIADSIAVK